MRKYDNYKDSGIEWIGEIPEHWEVKKLKRLAKIVNGQDHKNVWDSSGKYPIIGTGGEFGKANTYLHKGPSVILGRKGTIDKPQYIDTPFWSVDTAYFTDIYQSVNPKLFYYLCTTINFDLHKYGSAVPSMTQEVLTQIPFVIPNTIEEQTAIASYLDRKTAEIDELIADKKRLLELYEEEKTAIINQAVTQGINPDVPMKDSGVEWLGEIPEHWEVKKIGHCGKIVRGGSPRPSGDPRYFMGDFIHWITVKEVTNATGKYVVGSEEFLTEEGSKLSRIIEPETLLLSNSGATLGVPKISKIKGCINDGSVAFPELRPFLNRDYLYYFFESHTKIYREQMAGNGQPNLNTEIIKSTFIPLPNTIEEQIKIVEFIEAETQKVEAKKSKTEKLIELLTEYRTALISEVVTGKIKVIENL